jgi:hypothetical protein
VPSHASQPPASLFLLTCFWPQVPQAAGRALLAEGATAVRSTVIRCCHTVRRARDFPPPGQAWSFWVKQGGFHSQTGGPFAQAVCLPFAFQSAGISSNEPPRNNLISTIFYRGSGYAITIKTMSCASAKQCHRSVRQGRSVTLRGGSRVWVGRLKTRTPQVMVSWSSGDIAVRLVTNLPVWWAERVAEHVKILR